MATKRPAGVSSRLRRARGERHPWAAPAGHEVDLPVVLDIVHVDEDTGVMSWRVEATVDVVGALPTVVRMRFEAAAGLDLGALQEHFRWATPLDVVTQTVPILLSLGIDPFHYDYPTTGFPDAAYIDRATPTRLTDEFLGEIAVRYLLVGRGYARTIAAERNVSPRTVVSWIEKARERGILSPTTPGAAGGRLMPVERRKADRRTADRRQGDRPR
jgi:hypothetical protein